MECSIPVLYDRYYVKKGAESEGLFRLLKNRCQPAKGLYPGSFVHITPSFFIQEMVYIDSDRRIGRFFDNPELPIFIENRKTYSEPAVFRSYQADFTTAIPEEDSSFDIMFSLYSGFISLHCKRYLKKGGILVANNSHGDAGIAFTDNEYKLIGVVELESGVFRLSESRLDEYFIRNNRQSINRETILHTMKGERYTKTGYAYLFRREG